MSVRYVETTWVSGKIFKIFRCFKAKTSVQITFLANLTGILVFLTYDHHVDGFLLLSESNMRD